MVVVADEVGANTSQKGDGHAAGEKFICARGTTPQTKVSTKDKHYTVMGYALLTGEPVMYLVIMKGKKQ